MENFVAKGDLKYADLDQDVSVKKNVRTCFCTILLKSVTAFCHCLKSPLEVKVKIFLLIAFKKEVLKTVWYKFCCVVIKDHSYF